MVKYQKEAWRGNEPKSESLTKRYGFTPDKGRSFYVERAMLARCYVYEKASNYNQLNILIGFVGNWNYVQKIVIPFDVLLSPANYLSASYPALQFVEAEQQCEIKTLKLQYFTCVDNAIKKTVQHNVEN